VPGRVDPREFRRAMAQFATGITVVTTRDGGGQPLGLTVNAFASVSLEPPLLLICVDHRSETHLGFRTSARFGVSVLADSQEEMSRRFAAAGSDKFAGLDLVAGEHGVDLVPGALAHFECRVAAAHLAGDHTVYVGEVLGLRVFGGRPLVYHASAYRRLCPDRGDDTGPPGGAEGRDRL
jgi:flavin reductase (DIM6/NTAB) family NADH-FMN oxidoreductase RutF